MFWNLKTRTILVVVLLLSNSRINPRADEPLQYRIELGENPQRGPDDVVDGVKINGGLVLPQPAGPPPSGEPDPSPFMTVQVTLANVGATEQVVYWPDGAATEVFQFEFIHVATGQQVPVLASAYRSHQQPPQAVGQEMFRRLAPGDSITQLIRINDKATKGAKGNKKRKERVVE